MTAEVEAKITELTSTIEELFRSHMPLDRGNSNRLNLEDTQQQILSVLKNIESKKSSGGGGSSSESEKENKRLAAAARGAADSLEHTAKRVDKNKEAFFARTQPLTNAIGKLANKIGISTLLVGDSFKKLSTNLGKFSSGLTHDLARGDFSDAFRKIAEGVLGSGIVNTFEQISTAINNNLRTYNQLNEYGATFGGSLLQMNIQAAESRMSLESFSKAIQRNSYAIAAMGGPRVFGGLSKAVRDNFEKFGQFGLEIDQVNERLGDYLETERVLGNSRKKTNTEMVSEFTTLIDTTDRLSKATGKQREQILKDIQEFRRSVEVYGVLKSIPGNVSKEVDAALSKSAAIFSAIPGETGKQLLSTLPTAMTLGTSLYTDIGKDLNAFAPNIRNALDQMSAAVKAGDVAGSEEAQFRMIESAKAMSQNTSEMQRLSIYARAGNQQAQNTLKVIQEMAAVDTKKLKEELKARKEYENTTKFLQNLQKRIQDVASWFKTGFLKGFEPLAKQLNALFSDSNVENFRKRVEEFGAKIGGYFVKIFSPERMASIGKSLSKIATTIGGFLDKMFQPAQVDKILGYLDSFGKGVKFAYEVVTGVFTTIKDIITKIYGFFSLFTDNVALAATLTAGTTVLLYSVMKSLLSAMVTTISNSIVTGFKKGVIDPLNRRIEESRKNQVGGGGFLGGFGKKALRAAKFGSVAGIATMLGSSLIDEERPGGSTAKNMLEWGGIGATAGGVLGSFVPGIGNAIGAVAGGAIGAVYGGILANWNSISEKLGLIASESSSSVSKSSLWFKNFTGQIDNETYEIELRALKLHQDQLKEFKKNQIALAENTTQLKLSSETQYKGAEVFLKNYTDAAGKEQQVLVTLAEFSDVLLTQDPAKQIEMLESIRKSEDQKARGQYFVSGGKNGEKVDRAKEPKIPSMEEARRIAAENYAKEKEEKRKQASRDAGSVKAEETGINLAKEGVLSNRETIAPFASRVVKPEEQAVQKYTEKFKETGTTSSDFIKNAQVILKKLDKDIRSSRKEPEKQALIKQDQEARLAFKKLINEVTEQSTGLSYNQILDSLLQEKMPDEELRLRTVEGQIYRLIHQDPMNIINNISERMKKISPEELERIRSSRAGGTQPTVPPVIGPSPKPETIAPVPEPAPAPITEVRPPVPKPELTTPASLGIVTPERKEPTPPLTAATPLSKQDETKLKVAPYIARADELKDIERNKRAELDKATRKYSKLEELSKTEDFSRMGGRFLQYDFRISQDPIEQRKRQGDKFGRFANVKHKEFDNVESIQDIAKMFHSKGLLKPEESDLHKKIQDFFISPDGASNLRTYQLESGRRGKSGEANETISQIFQEFKRLYQENAPVIEETKKLELSPLQEELSKIERAQKENTETIKNMLSASPPFLLTIRDAILGNASGDTVYDRMISLLDQINQSIQPEEKKKQKTEEEQQNKIESTIKPPSTALEISDSNEMLGGPKSDTLTASKSPMGLNKLVSIFSDPKESLNYILENTSMGQTIKDNIQGAIAGGAAGAAVGGPFGAAVGTMSGVLLGKEKLDTASTELAGLVSSGIDYFFGKTIDTVKGSSLAYAEIPKEDLGIKTDAESEISETPLEPLITEPAIKSDTVLLMEQMIELVKEMKYHLQDLNESTKYLQAEIASNTKETARNIKDNPSLITTGPLGIY